MNLVRGTGMDGLRGIPVTAEHVIRPMLFASRKDILAYAQQNSIQWREDSSNATDDYQRNMIRHQIIPRLLEINPALEETFSNTHERIDATVALAKAALQEISSEISIEKNDRIVINKKKLETLAQPQAVLWELIKRYGFNYQQCKLLMESHQPGKFFESEKARITSDREQFIVEQKQDLIVVTSVQLQKEQPEITLNSQRLLIHEVDAKHFILSKDRAVAQLDAAKISFPVTWRHWKNGDTFIPLGMTSHKKISDLLIDEKVAVPDKRTVTVLESDGKIVWVVGFRICETLKVTDQTKKVLIIESLPL
jgi:tRNA(Ile)-lysidine synthase